MELIFCFSSHFAASAHRKWVALSSTQAQHGTRRVQKVLYYTGITVVKGGVTAAAVIDKCAAKVLYGMVYWTDRHRVWGTTLGHMNMKRLTGTTTT